tara:strand:+ start:3706 stop:3987 length:282 start_codon:yes stop_codon:yes gene_type:complete
MSNYTVDDLSRMEKKGWRMAESIGAGSVTAPENPLAGIIQQQNTRTRNARDVLDIGSGTRCGSCGMLHFCWVERCGACSKPMDYNLGTVRDAQ